MKKKTRDICCTIITAYQHLVSPFLGSNCLYHPSCSQYAKEAIAHHGVIKGLVLATWRIMRCHPFSKGGADPPPETFILNPFKRFGQKRNKQV